MSLLCNSATSFFRCVSVAIPFVLRMRLLRNQLVPGFALPKSSCNPLSRSRGTSFHFLSSQSLVRFHADALKLQRVDGLVPWKGCALETDESIGLVFSKSYFRRVRSYRTCVASKGSRSLPLTEKDPNDGTKAGAAASEVKKRRKTTKDKTITRSPTSARKTKDTEELIEKGTSELPSSSISSSQEVIKKTRKSSKKKSPKEDSLVRKCEAQNLTELKPIRQWEKKSLYPPIGKSVMVVESLTKAKAIQCYLGDMFVVLPSYGHVRDLAARSGSVRPDDDFSMVWEIPSAAWTHIKNIKEALIGADNLILASDPDREGEAIAWHVLEMLLQQDALRESVHVARVVFHQITETSVKNALMNPREIDSNLVYAYLARRALDYLIGFNISPLLWRKLPGCSSAGRVQSAALSLICDKETEIDLFKPTEYWSVEVQFHQKPSAIFHSHLSHFSSKKLSQLSITSQMEATNIQRSIMKNEFVVLGSKTSTVQNKPPNPFITSTLQQEAANKLYFSPMTTMRAAQKLYEGFLLSDGKISGLITYPRTDGSHIANDAIDRIRFFVTERYNEDFVAVGSFTSVKKVKNAQEAHEAIRPTDIFLTPSMLADKLDEESLKLYTLIWCRTVACQMRPEIVEQVKVDFGDSEKSTVFHSCYSKVVFPGYRAVYKDNDPRNNESKDDNSAKEFQVVKSLKIGDPLNVLKVETLQHFTQAPSRYSEGSLVKKLEDLGIGRPSTYASILKVLKDRNYVTLKNRTLHPEFRGRMVTTFLSQHFSDVTNYGFTADMESELDNVCAGLTEWKVLLHDYWTRFKSHYNQAQTVTIHQVEKLLEKKFGDLLFTSLHNKNKTCPSCMVGTLTFKISKFGDGYFIGCNQHPNCKYVAKTFYGDDEDEEEDLNSKSRYEEPKLIGLHPISNDKIFLKKGPYGSYVQLGEDKKGHVPKRVSASHIKDAENISLEDALKLLRYPLTLGKHPEDGQPIIVKIGQNGFIIRYKGKVASLPKNILPDDLTIENAVKILSGKSVRSIGRPKRKGKDDVKSL